MCAELGFDWIHFSNDRLQLIRNTSVDINQIQGVPRVLKQIFQNICIALNETLKCSIFGTPFNFIVLSHGRNKSLHDNLNGYVFKYSDVAICFQNRKLTVTRSINKYCGSIFNKSLWSIFYQKKRKIIHCNNYGCWPWSVICIKILIFPRFLV